MEIKGYITNLGKYNEGMLIGKWVTFPIDEDELQEVLKEIGVCYYDEEGEYINTGYEEFFFTDWECDFANNFGEYESIDKINDIANNLNDWDDDLFAAACELWDIDEILNNSADDYYLYEDINTDLELGYYYAEVCCIFADNKMDMLERYFDYEMYGRDIRLESDGGFTKYGWIEYIG